MAKRCFCGIILVLVSISAQIAAQSKPFAGYDKVAWGISVEDVRKTYSISNEIAVKVDDEDKNISTLTQENPSDSIEKRHFSFNKNKLYRVNVVYNDSSDSNANTLKGLLEQRYGKPTDYRTESQTTLLGYVTDAITIFGKFSPDIEVELIQREAFSFLNILSVVYIWKKFSDEYQAAKLGL